MRLHIDGTDAKARPHAHTYRGFNEAQGGWVIPRPANPHVHFRDPETQSDIFTLVVPETAKLYAWATAMPNLGKNRIRTPEQAIAYRDRILELGRTVNPTFEATVPLYLEPDIDHGVIREGHESGAFWAAKLYPKNGTTESDHGIDFRDIRPILPTLKVMEELDMLCLVHAEVVLDQYDELVVDRFREGLAIDVIDRILRHCPKLRVVFEHISSRASIEAYWRWRRKGCHIEATIAPQYLLWNSSVLFERGMNPINFSIPILKDEEDRVALVEFMLEGGGMLGTDSAPHDLSAKSRHEHCPGGLFNEPVGLFIYFHLFRTLGGEQWFEQFVDFACRKAAHFYNVPESSEEVVIAEEAWQVPPRYTHGSAIIIPMLADTVMPYSLKRA